jgi:hypothetical protein
MKKLLLAILIFLAYGCNQSKAPNPSTSTSDTANGCPDQPQGSLEEKSVKKITLSNSSLTESGQVGAGKQKAFLFEAKKGQKLSYRTKDDICIWVYSPDNTVLNGDEFKVDGKHTMQVAALKGSTSFTLEMSLGSLSTSSSTGSSSSGGSTDTASPPSLSGELDQAKAQQLVQTWLDSKSKIFAPPFDRNLVKQITTGPLYQDIVKPNGPVDWLQSNNSYYSYSKLSIDKIWAFSSNGGRPSLKVTISENRVLYGKNGKPDPVESGSSTKNWIYFFIQADGVWKIHDYREES